MPRVATPDDAPYVRILLSYARGQMGHWSFHVQNFTNEDSPIYGKNLAISVSEGITRVYIHTPWDRTFNNPVITVKGLHRAAVRMSELWNVVVVIDSDTAWSCSERAKSLFGVFGTYTPPPPPTPPTVYPLPLLREARAEYHARVRGEFTGTKLGYCQVADGCPNVAASIVKTDFINDRYTASCKAHEPIPAVVVAEAVALVKANGKIYAKEVTSFGLKREVFVRAQHEGSIVLVKEGPYTRWIPAPVGTEAVPAWHSGRKVKATSRARRYRGGA